MSGRNLRTFAAALLLTLLAAGPAAALPALAPAHEPAGAGWLEPLRQLLLAAWESLAGEEGSTLDPNG